MPPLTHSGGTIGRAWRRRTVCVNNGSANAHHSAPPRPRWLVVSATAGSLTWRSLRAYHHSRPSGTSWISTSWQWCDPHCEQRLRRWHPIPGEPAPGRPRRVRCTASSTPPPGRRCSSLPITGANGATAIAPQTTGQTLRAMLPPAHGMLPCCQMALPACRERLQSRQALLPRARCALRLYS